MSSVAGQIRIDLIARSAEFKAGMRDAAKEGFGGFQQEAERFNRWFNSQKPLADRVEKEKDAWQTAMKGLRADVAGGGAPSMLPWYSLERMHGRRDVALQNQTRWKGMIPWGMTLRTELSREAAETAARIGAEGQKVARSLSGAMRDIAGEAAATGGFGGVLGGVGRFAMGHPGMTAAGVGIGLLVKGTRDRTRLAREVGRESEVLGATAEDTSRLKAVGFQQEDLARLQRAMAQQTPEQLEAFRRLGVDPAQLASKGLAAAVRETAAGFDRLKNHAERTHTAMQIFGRGGADLIGTLHGLADKMGQVGSHQIIRAEDVARVKAFDQAMKELKKTGSELSLEMGRALGTESGIGTHLARGTVALKYLATWDWKGFDEAEKRWKKADSNIAHADEIERRRVAQARLAKEAEDYAEALKRAATYGTDLLRSLEDQVIAMQYGEKEAGRIKLVAGYAKELGHSPRTRAEFARLFELEKQYDKAMTGLQDARRETAVRDAAKEEARRRYPLTAVQEELRGLRELRAQRRISEDQYADLRLKHLRDYYREVSGLEADRMEKELRSSWQKFLQEKRWRESMASSGLIAPGLAARAEQKSLVDLRKGLGVKDPLGDYARSMRELAEAFFSGRSGITREQFARRRRELRRGAVTDTLSDVEDLRPSPAIAAGSREFHAAYTQQLLADPKIALAQQTVAKLDRIDRKLASLVKQGEGMGNPLDE